MAWVSSREFANNYRVNLRNLQNKLKGSKKIFNIHTKIFSYKTIFGIGRGGKVLKIWDEPFESEEEAMAFYEKEVLGAMMDRGQGVAREARPSTTFTTFTTSPKMRGLNVVNGRDKGVDCLLEVSPRNDSMDSGLPCSHLLAMTGKGLAMTEAHENNARHEIKPSIYDRSYLLALEKQDVIKEWERAKRSGIRAKDFIYALNAKNNYSFELSENKLFAWLRAYKEGGFEALRDERGKNRKGVNRLKELGCEELVISLIKASKGGININSMHRALHILLHREGKFDFEVFNSKKGEAVSYSVLRRFVQEWLKANPMAKKLILKGSDALTSSFAPAVGEVRRGSELNEIVEIDGTSLDLIINAKEYANMLGVSIEGEWQKRFSLIQLVDTYSKVRSFFICESENKLGIARAIAKYISKFGKPKIIRGDNGKAFTSRDVQACLLNLGIKYERTRAYSGWEKPFVEKGFGTLQNHLMEWMKGYIGHSVSQRQAIEFFFNRKERRLKKGHKTHLRDLHLLSELNVILDDYVDSVMLNSYDEALGCSPLEAFNAESHKAEAIHEYELSAKLLPAMRRSVGKEGVSMDGYKYVHPKMFSFSYVYLTQNINNLFQSFVFDPEMNFLGEAILKDGGEMLSAEMAKNAKREHQKRVRAIKKGIEASRKEVELGFLEGVKKIKKSSKELKAVRVKPINSVMEKEVKIKEAKEVKALDLPKSPAKEDKRDLSWEACVLKEA